MDKLKYINKKRLLIPVSIVLMITMLILPMVSATNIASVASYNNVSTPNNIIGSNGSTFATFFDTTAQLVGSTSPSPVAAGTLIKIRADSSVGKTATASIYIGSSSTGPWTYVGAATINGAGATWTTGYTPVSGTYLGIHTSGNPLWVAYIQ